MNTHPQEGPAEADWVGAPARLDRVLTDLGLVRSRSQATDRISAGVVTVNGTVARKTGLKVAPGSRIVIEQQDAYVSRAAHKLIAGLDAFAVGVTDRVCLDVGASTGGFTQVLLERGARFVHAIDVGHGQMVPAISEQERVLLLEGANARDLSPEMLGIDPLHAEDFPTLIVADLSFISLRLVLEAMGSVAGPNTDFVLLVKPQFEVGRAGVRGGIVHDPGIAAEAILEVCAFAAHLGYGVHGIIPSPIPGGQGNQEFVIHFSDRADFAVGAWRERISASTAATIGSTAVRSFSAHRSDG